MTLAWIGAALIGVLLGSGGSILTVPVLVYLVGESDKLAIAESLAIVGGISLFGAVPYALQRRIDWRSVGWFGVPGVLGTFGGRGPERVPVGCGAAPVVRRGHAARRRHDVPSPARERRWDDPSPRSRPRGWVWAC